MTLGGFHPHKLSSDLPKYCCYYIFHLTSAWTEMQHLHILYL